MSEATGTAITWATLSAIAAIIIGLVGLTKLAITPQEERIQALRERMDVLERVAGKRLDGFELRLRELEQRP